MPSYDYYTGAPDLSPVGAPTILPGYGPNTRTIMQVNVAATTPAATFNLAALQAAFRHKADGSGVFESGQHPIIVGQAAYNSAYGTNFAASSWCNAPGSTSNRCDGFVRISEQGGDLFGFNTLQDPATKLSIKLEPKAIHDEMNSASFDEFGRMTANLGLEAVPATPAAQNVILYPYVNPSTELIDATNLPSSRRQGHPDRDGRRHPDLEDHPQRGRHTPDPLPPVRRPDTQPSHVGQHHHPARRERAWLEGHHPSQPARRHHRGPQADHTQLCRSRSPTASASSAR